VSFSAPGAAPMRKCRPGGRRAGDFVLSHEDQACGIDISKLPFIRSEGRAPGRAGNVWARAMGDIAALKHVMDGDPVAVEAID
jgi:hypothetical protein